MTTTLSTPSFPVVTKFVSKSIFAAEGKEITWVLGKPHPISKGMTIVRMFIDDLGGVEVYSTPAAGAPPDLLPVRNRLPVEQVKLTEEVMSPDVFVEEIAAAEGTEEPDDEPDDLPQTLSPPLALVPNDSPPVS